MFSDYVKAAVAALKASAALTAKVGTRIGEAPSDKWDFPNVYIEPGLLRDWSTKSWNGVDTEFTVNIGSRYNGTLEARTIADAVYAALHYANLVLDSGQAVLSMHDNTTFLTDQDGVTRRCIMRFRILISEG